MRLLITMILTLVLSCSKNTESNDVEYSYEESDPTEVSDQDGSEVHTSFTNPALNLQGSSLSISLAVSEIKTASPVSSFSLKGTKEKRETKHDVGKGATKQGDKLSTKDIVSVTLDVQRLVFVKSNGDEEVADVNQRLEYSDLSNITSLFSHELDPNDFNSIKIYLGDGNKVSYRDSDGIETDVLKIKHPKHKYVTIQHPFHVIENVQTEISVDFNLSKSIVYNKVHGWNLKPHFQVTASQLLPVGSGVLRCEDDFVVYGSPNSEWHKAANVQEALELASEGDTIEISRSPADTNLLVLEKTGLTLMSSCNARLSNLTIKDSKNIMIASLELTAIAEGQQSILVEGSNSNIILVSNTISTRLAGINGLASTGEVSSLSIFNNKIVNNGSYGIVLRGSYDNIAIQGNSISNNSLSALKMEGKFLGKIVDNTIMFNGSSNPQEGYGIDYREVSQSSSLIVSENQFYKNNGTIVPNSSRDIASIFSAITEYEDVNNMTSDGKEDSQISPFYVESLCSSNLTKSIYHDYSNKFVLWKKGIWNQQESFIESASNPDNKLEIRPHLTGVYDISIESEEGIEPRVDFYSSNLNGFDEKSVVLEADGVTSIGSYYIGCGSVFRLASPDPLKIKSIKFEKKEQMDAVDRLVSKDVGATLEVPGQLEIYVEPGILDNDTLIGIAKAEMPADLPDSIVSVGSSYEMSPSGLQFSDDGLSVSLYYDKDEVNKLTDDPHKLTLITKNIEGEWVAIDSHVEPEIGRISGRMRHFSPLLIVYGWNLTTASCELKKLHIDWPLTDLSMKIEDECVSRAVTDAALNLLNRSGYKTGLQEEFSGDYRMMYIEAPAASMENGKIIVNFGIKTWFRTKLFSIDDKVHYSSKQRIDLNLKLIFSTKIINGKFQYVFLFPLLDLDISNVGDADDFLTAMIHGVAAFANTYFNFSNNMDVYLDELIFNALSFVVIFNNFTLSQMYQTIYGINGNNQLKSDIKKTKLQLYHSKRLLRNKSKSHSYFQFNNIRFSTSFKPSSC